MWVLTIFRSTDAMIDVCQNEENRRTTMTYMKIFFAVAVVER